jgi:hypothetical protein
VVAAIVLLVGLLVGFVPQYVRANRLDSQLQQASRENSGAQLRDLAGLAYVQANQKNYGLAAATCTRFFDRAREVANQMGDANQKKAIEDLLASRDRVTAALAKGDAGVMNDLQDLFTKTRQATRAPGEP